jgi:SAM-dependent methyltransferase
MELTEIYRRRFEDGEARVLLWQTLVESFFQRYVDADDIVLDLPCGYGEFINSIRCKTKYALDVNRDAIKYLASDVTYLEASSTAIPLDDGSVTKVFVSNFFEHLTRDEIADTIVELHRVLKAGGRVLVLQPNIRFASKNYWMFFDHITPVDDRALEEVFTALGFRLHERITRFLPFTTKGKLPMSVTLVRLYLRLPLAWRILGQQSFLVFEREGLASAPDVVEEP